MATKKAATPGAPKAAAEKTAQPKKMRVVGLFWAIAALIFGVVMMFIAKELGKNFSLLVYAHTATPTLTPTAAPTSAPTSAPTATPTAAPTATPIISAPPAACRDGELVLVHAADAGDTLDRLPVGEGERVDIMEISWPGQGFGGLDRAIIVIPRLGNVWQVNVLLGAQTVATRGFCGTNEAVAEWAVTAHVPSLQQASRDATGNQPPAAEIGVYRLDYEARALIVVQAATAANAPSPEEVLTRIELSFHEDGNVSAVPLTVAP